MVSTLFSLDRKLPKLFFKEQFQEEALLLLSPVQQNYVIVYKGFCLWKNHVFKTVINLV